MENNQHDLALSKVEYETINVVIGGKSQDTIYKFTYERDTPNSPWELVKKEKVWPTPGTSVPTMP
ncbi:hypothetical protein [Hymenobacter sp. GOD-10R]|uniref:hypothetical protein n=1 Tax=Hymenobacter sp. GOD-10R TaxID=3093922 RepID=UPI002D792783|nr:hypothetical protein [Hymenobacter sp. GOD-10R]WRQ29129.1 hypothetical protein SD425_02485 [Hymenobacter sp. GOD-10R]